MIFKHTLHWNSQHLEQFKTIVVRCYLLQI